MKSYVFTLLVVCAIFKCQAQDYTISFAGTGDTNIVHSVKVINLASGASVSINGDDILHLVGIVGISDLEGTNESIQIFPNPVTDKSVLTFNSPGNCDVIISIVDLSGRTIYKFASKVISGANSFYISGVHQGMYLLNVTGKNYSFSTKFACNSNSPGNISVESITMLSASITSPLKSSANIIDLPYSTGDRLLFKSSSGRYSTIVTDIPNSSKTMLFNFAACSDFEGNNYPVVQIGTQKWMAKNLRATRFNDGTPISFAGGLFWNNTHTPGYGWYNDGVWFPDDSATRANYGAYYNWYTVNPSANGNKNVCPEGWHVPSKDEWTELITYLGGEQVAADKLMETGTTYWHGPNHATNETGFSARGAGYGDIYGPFHNMFDYGMWWSSTEFSSFAAWFYDIFCSGGVISPVADSKQYGFSIRCVSGGVPFITTSEVSNITANTAVAGGNITTEVPGIITERGICYASYAYPTIFSYKIKAEGTTGEFSCNLVGLSPGSEYHIRAYAISNNITYYGNDITFTTLTRLPILISVAASQITPSSAVAGGEVQSDGGLPVTERGICYSLTPNPKTSDIKVVKDGTLGYFSCTLSGLIADTKYYFRSYAINSNGTAYGDELFFKTIAENGISDVDGNYYNTVAIGNQVWLAENLKTTKYNDGIGIPLVTESSAWSATTTPGYCWYNNDSVTYKNLYGALYNYQTVNPATNGGKNVCPSGWHVPKDADWAILTTFLGGDSVAGGKLKEVGLMQWAGPNTGATNESKFTALPGGHRYIDGRFLNRRYVAYWWSITDDSATNAWGIYIGHSYKYSVLTKFGKQNGCSVRCLKD